MNRVKKLSMVFIMVVLIIYITTNKTYAALNCNVNLSTSKNKVTYGEQFSVYVDISNLKTTNGIIAIGAVVSYDTDSLVLDSIEGQNKWSDPFYNSSNGKITSFKSELSTKDEKVFKIIFKVNKKGKAKDSAWIKISDFEISDGEEEKNCGGSSIKIKIKEQNSTNTGSNNQGDNNTQKPNTKPEDSNEKTENNKTTKPSTGTTKPSENSSTNVQVGNNKTTGSSTGATKSKKGTIKSSGSGSTNVQVGDEDNETTSNNSNDEDTDSIENVVGEDITNNEIETTNVQNTIEDNVEEARANKTMNKWLFYTISVVAIIIIIGILFVIVKYWKIK